MIALSLVVGGGLIYVGGLGRRDGDTFAERTGIPSLILLTVSVTMVVGSTAILAPWQYDGLTAGIRSMFWAMFLVFGLSIVLVGISAYASRNTGKLAVISGFTGLSLAWPLTHRQNVMSWTGSFYLVFATLTGVPILIVYYTWPRLTAASTATVE